MNYEKVLRRIRQRIFDFPPEQEEKAARLIDRCKAKVIAKRKRERRKPAWEVNGLCPPWHWASGPL
jgi:hypothetical protein